MFEGFSLFFTKGTQRRFKQLLVLNFLVLCGHVILRAKKKWNCKVEGEDCAKSLGTRGSRTKTLNTPPSYHGRDFLLNQYPKERVCSLGMIWIWI